MKKLSSIVVFVCILFLSSCQKEIIENEYLHESAQSVGQSDQGVIDHQQYTTAKKGQAVLTFRSRLSGDQEVPPNETTAKGTATFKLSKDGEELSFRLIVANLDNVTQAHIHYGEAGVNGPVVAWLYPTSPPAQLIPGRTSGILQEGVITKDELVGLLAGEELSELIDLMTNAQVYINVHTSQYPAGEIRGQITGNVKGN